MSGGRDRRGSNQNDPVLVIKRPVLGGGEGHHGGAWKVAYADFVTAMMAFFLLMWLLNATSEDQKRGIADYFSMTAPFGQVTTGSGQPFAGRSVIVDGARMTDHGVQSVVRGSNEQIPDDEDDEDRPYRRERGASGDGERGQGARDAGGDRRDRAAAPAPPPPPPPAAAGRAREAAAPPNPAAPAFAGADAAPQPSEPARAEAAAFAAAEAAIRRAVEDDPRLADLARQLRVEQTPEGLRVQILDAEGAPMFALGSARPSERTRLLLARVAAVLRELPNAVTIAGHTDSAPFRDGSGRTNWDLSADRANVTRRLLVEAGLAEERIAAVTAHADRQPLEAGDPAAAANRRVAILVLRGAAPGAATP